MLLYQKFGDKSKQYRAVKYFSKSVKMDCRNGFEWNILQNENKIYFLFSFWHDFYLLISL